MCVVGCAALPCLVLFVVALLTEKYDRQLFVVLLHTHAHTQAAALTLKFMPASIFSLQVHSIFFVQCMLHKTQKAKKKAKKKSLEIA